MKDESIKEIRRILIQYLLSTNIDTLTKDELLEAAIWIHHLYQPDTYKENGKALQKILNKKWEKEKNNEI